MPDARELAAYMKKADATRRSAPAETMDARPHAMAAGGPRVGKGAGGGEG